MPTVEELQKQHEQEEWERFLKDPYNPVFLAELIREGTVGKSKWSSSGLRWLRRLLRRSVARSYTRGCLPQRGDKRSQLEAWERGNKARRQTPELLHHYLKIRFEWNVKNQKCSPGEFKLTIDEVRWLFWELTVDDPRRGRKGEKVRLIDLDREVMLKRIDTKKDYELENLEATYRARRKSKLKKYKTKGRKAILFRGDTW